MPNDINDLRPVVRVVTQHQRDEVLKIFIKTDAIAFVLAPELVGGVAVLQPLVPGVIRLGLSEGWMGSKQLEEEDTEGEHIVLSSTIEVNLEGSAGTYDQLCHALFIINFLKINFFKYY